VKVHFIDGERVEMFFQEEGRARMYTYNLNAGTGRIISQGAVSTGIYDFTIKSTEANGIITEVFALTPRIGAVQQIAGANPDYFPVLELELLSEDVRMERKLKSRALEAQERERQEAERLERDRQEAEQRWREAEWQAQSVWLIELRAMRPRADELHKQERLTKQQFQDYLSLLTQFMLLQSKTSQGRGIQIPDLKQELSQMATILGAIEKKLSKRQLKDLQNH
jgi:hypothetical protein